VVVQWWYSGGTVVLQLRYSGVLALSAPLLPVLCTGQMTLTHTCTHTYTHKYTHRNTHIHTHTHTHTHIHTCTYIYKYGSVRSPPACTRRKPGPLDCYTVVTLLVHCWYTAGTLLVHCWYTVVTLSLCCRYTIVTRLLHCCYTMFTLLLLSSMAQLLLIFWKSNFLGFYLLIN
jgi:hypothetical protein